MSLSPTSFGSAAPSKEEESQISADSADPHGFMGGLIRVDLRNLLKSAILTLFVSCVRAKKIILRNALPTLHPHQ